MCIKHIATFAAWNGLRQPSGTKIGGAPLSFTKVCWTASNKWKRKITHLFLMFNWKQKLNFYGKFPESFVTWIGYFIDSVSSAQPIPASSSNCVDFSVMNWPEMEFSQNLEPDRYILTGLQYLGEIIRQFWIKRVNNGTSDWQNEVQYWQLSCQKSSQFCKPEQLFACDTFMGILSLCNCFRMISASNSVPATSFDQFW